MSQKQKSKRRLSIQQQARIHGLVDVALVLWFYLAVYDLKTNLDAGLIGGVAQLIIAIWLSYVIYRSGRNKYIALHQDELNIERNTDRLCDDNCANEPGIASDDDDDFLIYDYYPAQPLRSFTVTGVVTSVKDMTGGKRE